MNRSTKGMGASSKLVWKEGFNGSKLDLIMWDFELDNPMTDDAQIEWFLGGVRLTAAWLVDLLLEHPHSNDHGCMASA